MAIIRLSPALVCVVTRLLFYKTGHRLTQLNLPAETSMPLILFYLLLLFAAGILLLVRIQIGTITISFDKLGLSPQAGMLLILGSLTGSGINIPVYLHRLSE